MIKFYSKKLDSTSKKNPKKIFIKSKKKSLKFKKYLPHDAWESNLKSKSSTSVGS